MTENEDTMASNRSKTLDAPDAFQVQAMSVVDRLARNPKPWFIGGGIIIALLVGGFVFDKISDAKEEKRQDAISEIDRVYEAEMKSYVDAREALEKQRQELVAKNPSAVPGQPPVETPEIKALNDKIHALKADNKGSAEKYEAFYKANPKAPEGLLAGLKHASYLADNNDLDGARSELEKIVADAKKEDVVQMQGLLLLISIVEDKGDFDAAVKYADQLEKVAGPELKAHAQLAKAQAQYLKKDFPSAKATLEKLIADHGTTPEAERARGLLALIPG